MIIGREKEQKKLRNLYENGNAEFVAVYGRRRVGKTYLVDELFHDRITFRHAGLSPIGIGVDENGKDHHMKGQLEHFYRSLLMQGMEECSPPISWLEAFYLLERFLISKDDNGKRQLIFLDEIQWMDTPKAGFMTGLEAFWNSFACHRHNIMLIVCGSSTSWILDKLINNHGGLYGRLTYQIELQPFNLYECEQFFLSKGFSLSRYDIAQAYMAVGGIPYYLNYFDKALSIPKNIQAMFFDRSAPLKDEFNRLFSSLFTNPEVMKSLVIALNSKKRGLTRSELLNKTGITDSGSFSRQLKALESGAFILKYDSFGNGKRESFYKLADPFCIFYLRFVSDSSSRKKKEWINVADSQAVVTWSGLAFENVCFNHIKQIKAALGISGVSTYESLWSKKGTDDTEGAQIDLIIERKDNVVNMCEVKFYSDEFIADKNCHFSLVRKERLLREILPKKVSIHNTLITTFGLKHIEYFGDFVNTITMEDLFRPA
ncbi:MAG: AAA family ATPase [Parasporobacterium sp.]|nr:AAA family ATPase [Parasporobacterium sp.]